VAIYTVLIVTEAIREEVTLAADSEDEARRLAIASAIARMTEAATVIVKEVPPDPDP
jgi:hypothetical protein